ncbi:MAG: hypothetical protein GXO12_04960 [Epsilonproteobacteria bacterium]|nr:hypothetical protein [Campylobacterota bacterium]
MKKIVLITLLSLFWSLSLQAVKIDGVELDKNITINNQKLTLNGAGTRSVFFIDVYVGALYLKNRSQDSNKIINSNEPMDIKMVITSSLVTSKKMVSGLLDAFKKAEKSGYKADKDSVERFLKVFQKDISKKDTFDIFANNRQMYLFKNGKLYDTIDSDNLKKAVFAIWLGKYPAQESLKEKMLGH